MLAEPIIRILFQRGALGTGADAGRRRSARRVQRGPRLQRRDADAEPRVLQPAVELDPDLRSRSATSSLNVDPRRRLLPLRHLGDPARDRRSATSPARSRWSCSCAGGSAGSAAGTIAVSVAAQDRRRGRRPSPPVAYVVWRPLDSALGRSFPARRRVARARARGLARRLLRSPVARCGCASCRRYSPCGAACRAAESPWTSSTSATSRSSRTSTTASRRSPIASSS